LSNHERKYDFDFENFQFKVEHIDANLLAFYEKAYFTGISREQADEKNKRDLDNWDIKIYPKDENEGENMENQTKDPQLLPMMWAFLIFHFAIFGTFLSKQKFLVFGDWKVNIEFFKQTGKKTIIASLFRNEIGDLLDKHQNVLYNLLKKQGITIPESQRRFLFIKGYLLAGDKLVACKGDIDFIFKNISHKRNLENRKWEFFKPQVAGGMVKRRNLFSRSEYYMESGTKKGWWESEI
jgi:hypothetical protein